MPYDGGKKATPTHRRLECRPVTLREVRAMPHLPSSYETNMGYRLTRSLSQDGVGWTLQARTLPQQFRKVYDFGDPDDWLRSYAEIGAPKEFQFVAAIEAEQIIGLLTWKSLTWNGTCWLLDLRVAEAQRRRGIAGLLLEHLKRSAREHRLRGIHVETQTTNYPAIGLYLKHGFEIAGFHDHLYTNADSVAQEIALYLFWESG